MSDLRNDVSSSEMKDVVPFSAQALSDIDIALNSEVFEPFQKQIGFTIISNLTTGQIESCGSNVNSMLGYEPQEITKPFLNKIIHPIDLPILLDYERMIFDFLSEIPVHKRRRYNILFDFRLLSKENGIRRMWCQAVGLKPVAGSDAVRAIVLLQDISHLRKGNHMTLSILGIDGALSFPQSNRDAIGKELPNPLTKREREVLKLISDGMSSKSIASYLQISKNTVSNHRRNILRKTQMSSSPGFVKKAVDNAWV